MTGDLKNVEDSKMRLRTSLENMTDGELVSYALDEHPLERELAHRLGQGICERNNLRAALSRVRGVVDELLGDE